MNTICHQHHHKSCKVKCAGSIRERQGGLPNDPLSKRKQPWQLYSYVTAGYYVAVYWQFWMESISYKKKNKPIVLFMYFRKTISLKLKRLCFDSEGVFHLWPLRLCVQNHMDRKRFKSPLLGFLEQLKAPEGRFRLCKCETAPCVHPRFSACRPFGGSFSFSESAGSRKTASPRDLGFSEPGSSAWVTWQRRAETHARLWSGLSGTGSLRCWRTCTSSPWRTRTGAQVGTRSPPCSSSSSETIRSTAASRCSLACTTVCSSCATFASKMRVRQPIRTSHARSQQQSSQLSRN